MPNPRLKRREARKLRIKPEDRGLIDRAEEALLDRTIFAVSPQAYARFLARLEEPPRPNERLRRTLQAIPPWK